MSKIEHELRCWPGPYDAIADGRKLFEYRKNDRGYEVGDILYLRRFQPVGNIYTGASVRMVITYVLRAGFGVPDGYAVLGISSLDAADALQALQASVSAAGAAQPASAADPICMCGDSATLGVVHRTDGPCYYSSLWASASQPPVPASEAVPEGEFWELLHEWRETLDTERADWIENRFSELLALSSHKVKEQP